MCLSSTLLPPPLRPMMTSVSAVGDIDFEALQDLLLAQLLPEIADGNERGRRRVSRAAGL